MESGAALIQQLVPFALHTALCVRLGAFCHGMGWASGRGRAPGGGVLVWGGGGGLWCAMGAASSGTS